MKKNNSLKVKAKGTIFKYFDSAALSIAILSNENNIKIKIEYFLFPGEQKLLCWT